MESPKRSTATENKRNEMQKTKEAVAEEKDSKFYNIDYDGEDGDDDIFLSNVDKQVHDHNEAMEIVEGEGNAGLNMFDKREGARDPFKLITQIVQSDQPHRWTGSTCSTEQGPRSNRAPISYRQ
jgi:hypothetical protein